MLDENLSRRIVPFIQDVYPDSTQVALIGLEQVDDKATTIKTLRDHVQAIEYALLISDHACIEIL